ncbi:hypothetical protein JHK87_053697 [Glycine soja]|nr:hypothetical protein JHK87_053697 [Glycine soja]
MASGQAPLLEEAFNTKILSLPPPTRSINSADEMKTCRYHQNFGHTTEECVTLKDKIEELIQEGAFVNYIYTPNNNRGSYRARSRGRGGHHGRR